MLRADTDIRCRNLYLEQTHQPVPGKRSSMMPLVLSIPSIKFQQGLLIQVPSAVRISTDPLAQKEVHTPVRSKTTSKVLECEVGYLCASLIGVLGPATLILSRKISQIRPDRCLQLIPDHSSCKPIFNDVEMNDDRNAYFCVTKIPVETPTNVISSHDTLSAKPWPPVQLLNCTEHQILVNNRI